MLDVVPVDVSPERVIRTVAGLRPYRAPGFVVRAEPLGAKRLGLPKGGRASLEDAQ